MPGHPHPAEPHQVVPQHQQADTCIRGGPELGGSGCDRDTEIKNHGWVSERDGRGGKQVYDDRRSE